MKTHEMNAMPVLRTTGAVLGSFTLALSMAGCMSPALMADVRQATDAAHTSTVDTTQALYARMHRNTAAVEAEQEVDRPYLAGKRVPVARNVTLPLALRENVDTVVMFPERTMSLAVVAQRLQMATGIPVKIESDVYLPPNMLLPRSLAAHASQLSRGAGAGPGLAPVNPLAQGLGPMPALNGALPGVLTSPPPAGAAGAAAQPALETAFNVEFKHSERLPLANMLDLVATRLGINWEYQADQGVIRLYRLVTRSWELPMPGGTNSFSTEFRQGAQSAVSGGAGSGQSAQLDAVAKAEVKDQNDLEGIRKSIEPAMTLVGSAELNPASGLLTLRDTKEAVDAADQIVRRQVAIYSRMVTLKFQMIDLTVSDAGEVGVDWSAALTKTLQSVPGFTASLLSPTTLVTSTAGTAGLQLTSGGLSGSEAIVSALRQYGTVTSSVAIPISLRNRHGYQYNNRRTFSFVSGTTPAASAVGGTGGVPGITTSTATVGFKLAVYADATSSQDVNLTIAMDQSKQDGPLERFESGSGDNRQAVQTINLVGKGIPKQDLIVRNGQTILMTALDQDDAQSTRRTLGDALPLWLGGSQTVAKTRTFTLLLATVLVQEQGEGAR
ncbi:protein PilN [Cupriavidus pauculus]|uniref:protein PilN n=1 Tax=Cupriavidus pauculus TaxID=82633 RepID=UPI001EE2A231|nr:protein PilN [Cupriavidus pauculus]GJG97754.1 pilus assembly protein PilN [Cupriavidus pauculus]